MPGMDEADFWELVESARTADGPIDEAMVALLAGRTLEELVAYQQAFDTVTGRVHRWDVWAAAYLIGGGCSDDAFSDFKAGLVGLGHEWFARVAAAPDDLAEHPVVRAAAESEESAEQLFDEDFGYAASTAAEEEHDDAEVFWEATAASPSSTDGADGDDGAADLGEGWDFDDDAEMRARLPRLAALFLPSA